MNDGLVMEKFLLIIAILILIINNFSVIKNVLSKKKT